MITTQMGPYRPPGMTVSVNPGKDEAVNGPLDQINTLGQLFRANAQHAPSAACIVSATGSVLTWQQLLAQLERTHSALRTLGLGANDRVAIVLPNGPALAVAFLTVAACAACAPLNPAYGLDEFVFYLSDLKAQALIASDSAPEVALDAAAQL